MGNHGIDAELRRLREENAELKKDKARLDWLETHPLKAEVKGGSDDGHTGTFWGLGAAQGTLREAIDIMRNNSARCPNDTDGDGDCHLCHNKGGCPNR